MNEDIVVPVAFFLTVVVLVLGVPLVRAFVRHKDATALRTPSDPEANARLARIESAIEALALEMERVSEGQRFTTKLLSERQNAPAPSLPSADPKREAR